MKKQKKSGSGFYNYKGFLSLELLGMVDADYRFLLVDDGSNGFSSNTQTFDPNTVQVISRRVVGRAEETSTYSSLEFCTVNCRPTLPAFPLEAVPGIEPRF